jgi:hypothetical protein
MQLTTFVFVLLSNYFVNCEKFIPILFWHSAGESCCGSEWQLYSQFLKSQLENDVYIKSVQIGSTIRADRVKSLSTHPFNQIDEVCNSIKLDPKFKNGYNGVGLSQGALFMYALLILFM